MTVEPHLIEGPAALTADAVARLDRAVAVARSIFPATSSALAALRDAGFTEARLANDLDERTQQIESAAESLDDFRRARDAREWYCVNHGLIARDVFEESRDRIVPLLDDAQASGLTTLDANPRQPIPSYWSAHSMHRTEGGWNGHAYMGYIQGAIVHHGLVARTLAPSDIFAQRRAIAQNVAALGGRSILEMGCGNGPYTRALVEANPAAEIAACDISLRQLEQAQRVLNSLGASVALRRATAAETGFAGQSFDVVTSYALLHEIPAATTEGIFREALRLLSPGGTLYFVDVPPYSRLGKFAEWSVDYAARHEGEPFWRESATLDVASLLERIGFVDISRDSPSSGPYPFPFVTRAVRPR